MYPLFTPFGASSPELHGTNARAVGNPEEPSSQQRDFSLLREKDASGAGSYGYTGSSAIVDGIAHRHHQASASIPKAACGPIRGPLGDGSREQQQLQQQQSVVSSIGGILGPNDHHQACRGDNGYHKENDDAGAVDEAIYRTTSVNEVRQGVGSFGVEGDGRACYGDYSANNNISGNGGDVLRSLPGTDYIQEQQHW